MKAMKIIFWVLVIVPLIVTLVALPFLPDTIPAHYNINWQVDRWGSKFETLIFPAINIFMAATFFFSARYSAKHEANPRAAVKICYITGVCCFLFFDVLSGVFLYMDFQQFSKVMRPPVDLSKLVVFMMGLMFIAIGLIMPRQPMNSLFGFRTKASMANAYVWRVSQIFGGVAFIVAGLIGIIACFFASGMTCIWIFLGAVATASIAASIFPAIFLRRVN